MDEFEVTITEPKFTLGQQVEHLHFGYRGVIYDVDPEFCGDEEWYQQVAKKKPRKDKPWYRVLVHEADHTTYVAEQNIRPYLGEDVIEHPLLEDYFDSFIGGIYFSTDRTN